MRNFLQTLLHPDREDPEFRERGEVSRAADVLMVGEFQFLQLAYYEWFGNDMPSEMVDRLFGAYMIKNQVPHWALHFARRINAKDERGFIDPHSAFYHRYDSNYVTHVPHGLKQFCKASAFLVLFLVAAVWMAHFAVAQKGQFQFPPYVDAPEGLHDESASIDGAARPIDRN